MTTTGDPNSGDSLTSRQRSVRRLRRCGIPTGEAARLRHRGGAHPDGGGNGPAAQPYEMLGLHSMVEYDEIVRKMFCNEQEGFEFYNSYAKEKGFSVRRSYCEWDSGHTEMTLRKFVCSREGFREGKELKRENRKRKPRNITRVGCRAKLVIAREQNTGQCFSLCLLNVLFYSALLLAPCMCAYT